MFSRFKNLQLLFGACRQPVLIILRLIFGSTRRLALPRPVPDPEDILRCKDIIWQRYDGIAMLRQIPLFERNDTPTMSLYRMYEFLCADESNQLMLEMEYFWIHPSWSLSVVPDPEDDNPQREAVLASLVESLVAAFNYRYSLGLARGKDCCQEESCPTWTAAIPPLQQRIRFYDDCYADILGEFGDDPFSKRNIVANAGNLFSF